MDFHAVRIHVFMHSLLKINFLKLSSICNFSNLAINIIVWWALGDITHLWWSRCYCLISVVVLYDVDTKCKTMSSPRYIDLQRCHFHNVYFPSSPSDAHKPYLFESSMFICFWYLQLCVYIFVWDNMYPR